MVYAIAVVLRGTQVFENPARRTFVQEVAGSDRLRDAICLRSTEMNLANIRSVDRRRRGGESRSWCLLRHRRVLMRRGNRYASHNAF